MTTRHLIQILAAFNLAMYIVVIRSLVVVAANPSYLPE